MEYRTGFKSVELICATIARYQIMHKGGRSSARTSARHALGPTGQGLVAGDSAPLQDTCWFISRTRSIQYDTVEMSSSDYRHQLFIPWQRKKRRRGSRRLLTAPNNRLSTIVHIRGLTPPNSRVNQSNASIETTSQSGILL